MIERTITYYLEMLDKSEFKPKEGFKEKIEIKPISNDIFQQWMLFVGVGLPWRWYSRMGWSPDEWNNYFENNDSRAFLAFRENQLIGYFELLFGVQNEVEITFFGLFPRHIGAGYGGYLLSHAIETAWNSGVSKVWLHTCTSDHKSALSNYIARGFKIVKETEAEEDIPDKEEYLKLVNSFMGKYIDQEKYFGK